MKMLVMQKQSLMKQWIGVISMLALMAAFSVSAMAQAGLTKVSGTVRDEAGQPIAGAVVEITHHNTGRKFSMKTDKKGFFIQLGVPSGPYKVVLSKDGTVLWTMETRQVRLTPEDMIMMDIDLSKEKKEAREDAEAKLTEEEKKEMERVQTENAKIGNLNKMLQEGQAALQAGDFDKAIATFKATTVADPTRDLLWARLGDAYLTAAKASTDAAARKTMYGEGADAYKKALELATAPTNTKPKSPEAMGAYYNNLGEALGKGGDTPGALAAYAKAAEADPANKATYYFNEGATLTNSGKTDEAISAFDRAIAADATKADAYYLKGINLLSKATTKGDQMVPAPGTAEAFNKYLEMEPEGHFAEQAKQMLAAIGAKIETSYKKRGKK